MEKTALDKVCQQIYRRFPPMQGKRPKVSSQSSDRFLLIFSSSGKTPDGKTIAQTLRVVAASDGRILKTTMNR